MLTIKNLLKSMPKLEVQGVSDKQASMYIHDAMEYWFSLCYCGKKCKNIHGLNIHRAKTHSYEYKLMKLFKCAYVGGKKIPINKVGTTIQFPKMVDGKLKGKIIVT